MSYTTKPIEGELSLDKEYVLVDIDGYIADCCTNKYKMEKFNLTSPFKIEEWLSFNGKAFIGCEVVMATTGDWRDQRFFHEVIRQPQTNEFNTDSIAVTEQEDEEAFDNMKPVSEIVDNQNWKHGDICVFENEGAIVVGWHPEHPVLVIDSDTKGFIGITDLSLLSKPETEAQKLERERLEAAYDLYLAGIGDSNSNSAISFVTFKQSSPLRNQWLRVVDKTNYRK